MDAMMRALMALVGLTMMLLCGALTLSLATAPGAVVDERMTFAAASAFLGFCLTVFAIFDH